MKSTENRRGRTRVLVWIFLALAALGLLAYYLIPTPVEPQEPELSSPPDLTQPEVKPEPEAKPDPQPETKPEPEIKPEPEVKPAPDPVPDPVGPMPETPKPPFNFGAPIPRLETPVEDEWFSDAIFLGDSRTEGLYLYGGLRTPRYYFAKGLTVKDYFEWHVLKRRDVEEKLSLPDAMRHDGPFAKAYVMMGLNELGWPSAESFIPYYQTILEDLRAQCPEADIYVQLVLPVTAAQSAKDKIYNNDNVAAFNKAILEMCREQRYFIVDLAPYFCGEDGALLPENSNDGIHLNREACKKWHSLLNTLSVDKEAYSWPAKPEVPAVKPEDKPQTTPVTPKPDPNYKPKA